MLSVCVPVYNYDVRPLARQLTVQIKALSLSAEILFYDDGSETHFREINREIAQIKTIKYIELPENIGRAAIRNLMAKAALYPHLIFMDSDSELPDSDYLKRYADNIYNASVICGGTLYLSDPPEPDKMLRWVYGRKREQLSPQERQKKGFSITVNNFLVSRDVVLNYPFRENIREYGHEDTVFGFDIYKAGLPILHIENPVIHKGLETSGLYLEKTRSALRNLLLIDQNLIDDPVFHGHSVLLKLRGMLKRIGLIPIAAWLFKIFAGKMENNLTGNHPKLWIFDLYKAGYICSLK